MVVLEIKFYYPLSGGQNLLKSNSLNATYYPQTISEFSENGKSLISLYTFAEIINN